MTLLPTAHQRAAARFATTLAILGRLTAHAMDMPPLPALHPMCHVVCEVDELVMLGPAAYGERRYVPLGQGTVSGPELNGALLPGGVDWQIQRGDGVLEVSAHYVIRTHDDALVEVQSNGMRHGPAEVISRLVRGEAVNPSEYFFRTFIRFNTGAPQWQHLNRTMAVASGVREARRVLLDFYRVA